ncbi:MAG: hypothetical protein LCH84_05975 [Gemmatimonadetes bacterium]|nr:hypothetical protein [Gemmatimonadota bacterium]
MDHRVIVASAPTRLDFGGGWTDVPPYAEERGGFVCNLAIDRRATVTLRPAAPHDGARTDPSAGDQALVRAALRRADVHDHVAQLRSDFPIGAGLGGSSAAGVALAAALATLRGDPCSLDTLAERSRTVEVEELGIAGGRQDHYAAAYGGALGITFGATTRVQTLELSSDTIAALESRLLVVYTGESRISAETITGVLDAYRARERRVVDALDRMAILARAMRSALIAGDLGTLGALLDEHWEHQRSLHPAITTARIDAIEGAVRAAGAQGFKALGASGGGCVLVLAAASRVAEVWSAAASLGEPLAWRVAREGVRVERSSR